MRYMLLIYNNLALYQSWPESERQALFADVEAIMAELRETGELVERRHWPTRLPPGQSRFETA